MQTRHLLFSPPHLPKTRDGVFWKESGSAHLYKLLKGKLIVLFSFNWQYCIRQASGKHQLHQTNGYVKMDQHFRILAYNFYIYFFPFSKHKVSIDCIPSSQNTVWGAPLVTPLSFYRTCIFYSTNSLFRPE